MTGNSKNLVLDFTSQPTSLAGNFTNILDLTSKGDVLISGEIETFGVQTYNANVTLDGNTKLGGTALSLNGVNGGSHDLELQFITTTELSGNFTNIKNLSVLSNASLTGSISDIWLPGLQRHNHIAW